MLRKIRGVLCKEPDANENLSSCWLRPRRRPVTRTCALSSEIGSALCTGSRNRDSPGSSRSLSTSFAHPGWGHVGSCRSAGRGAEGEEVQVSERHGNPPVLTSWQSFRSRMPRLHGLSRLLRTCEHPIRRIPTSLSAEVAAEDDHQSMLAGRSTLVTIGTIANCPLARNRPNSAGNSPKRQPSVVVSA